MLRKRDCIILDVNQRNSKYLNSTHKFGIELSKTVAEAIYFDEKMVIPFGNIQLKRR